MNVYILILRPFNSPYPVVVFIVSKSNNLYDNYLSISELAIEKLDLKNVH